MPWFQRMSRWVAPAKPAGGAAFRVGVTVFVVVALAASLASCVRSGPASSLAPAPDPTATPTDLYIGADDIVLYPLPTLYGGDLVTFDVTPRNLGEIDPYRITVRVYHRGPDGAEVIGEGQVGYPTFDLVPRARLVWSWDTAGLWGSETITVSIDPDDVIQEGDSDAANNVVTRTVWILPDLLRPAPELVATWATTTTECCVLHYLTGSAAERDLAQLVAETDGAVDHVEQQLGLSFTGSLDVFFADRVIGQGGYALRGLTLSYLDRHYAGLNTEVGIRHEATHVVDAMMLTVWSPALVREGLAVWVSGGHYQLEPIPQRAAALLELGWYVPLEELADDFYRQQHEVGYLEGAAFVDYLVQTYGRDRFFGFYTSFRQEIGTQAQTLDAVLQEQFGMGLNQAEQAMLAWLETQAPTEDQVRDLELTVQFFQSMRRYQQQYDPSAYFRSGLLLDTAEAERRAIEADFIRHPHTLENIALETMLIAAREALYDGALEWAEELLAAVDGVLEEHVFDQPLAADFLAIVRAVARAGYEAQRVELTGERARVWAIADWPALTGLTLLRSERGWELQDD